MPDRERLIEILKLGSCPSPYLCDENCKYANLERCYEERTADLLLEHGVIVPPCKVGDTVYIPWHWNNKNGIAFAEVEEIKIYDSNNHYMFLIDLQSDDEEFNQSFGGWKIGKIIGETVFLTRKEAERALKERKNNG